MPPVVFGFTSGTEKQRTQKNSAADSVQSRQNPSTAPTAMRPAKTFRTATSSGARLRTDKQQ